MNTFLTTNAVVQRSGQSGGAQALFTNKHIWIICDGFLARLPLLDTLRNALPQITALASLAR